MFCIAAFIILAIISIFSASHRKLAKKAWDCTFRRITFRPCDSNFKDETKNKLLAHVANRTPRLIKLADISIEVASFALVVLTVWSLWAVIMAGVNLFVWGTCTPNNAAACSLSSETCSIESGRKGFWALTMEGKPYQWFVDEANDIVNTFANIPTKLRNWNATEYLPKNTSYYHEFDASKPTALEVFDPGCVVCSKLFRNIKEAGFEKRYNLAYIAYPIRDAKNEGEYKFKNSYVITTYLEAIKTKPLADLAVPADWQIMENIFSKYDEKDQLYQMHISTLSFDETRDLLDKWLLGIGYSDSDVSIIRQLSESDEIKNLVAQNVRTVEESIKTVKIPSIIFDGVRHDGILTVADLK